MSWAWNFAKSISPAIRLWSRLTRTVTTKAATCGNIHVHIVINSLRIERVPRMPYMDKDCDMLPGMKHRCTSAALRYFRAEVMEMCQREGLYQIDLLNGSNNRITEREYWAQKQGQKKLDEENAELIANGEEPKQTKFETDKQILRQQIRAALQKSKSLEDFFDYLLEDYGIAVKESRGRFSYLTPERSKPITSRFLLSLRGRTLLSRPQQNRRSKS